jgi:predicted RecA/RadA family phage recombinase
MFAHVHATGKGYFAHGGAWRKLLDETSSTTANLAEGANLYYTDARVDARISLQSGGSLDLSSKTTSDLAEGTNLYYTDARVRAAVSATTGSAGYNSSTGAFSIPANTSQVSESGNLYYTDARADARITNALGGNVTITGDLTVNGTTTTVDSNVVNIADSIITLNSDETGTPSQNGGIEIERGTSTNVQLRFNETSDAWEFTNDGTTYVALGTSATFTGNTDGVNEGSSNLYYTNARADARIAAASTTNLSEGTNLYYTDARADARIAAATTDDLSEGSNNLYYTEARDNSNFDFKLTTKSTSDLTEGANQYFTDARADARITNAGSANWNTAFGWGNHASAGYITSSGTATNFSSTTQNSQFNSIGVGTAASTTAGEIRATNDVTAYYSSDRSLKENVINITNALEKVKQIRGVEFDWTQEYIDAKGGEDGYFTRKHDVGVIAQEVEEVLPEVVGTREDGIKAVKYDRMVGLLIEAIKEQQSQIDELKQTVNNLTNK